MTRRQLLQTAVAAGRRPLNVVVMLADDLGWADTTPYGADLHETPHLERFAQSAVRFTNAYSASPVCSPTRASVMTGKAPARLHLTIWHEGALRPVTNRAILPPVPKAEVALEEVTLAETLRDAGYFTAHVGKWHLGTAGAYPEAQGFDVNIGGTHWGAPQSFFYPYRGTKNFGGELRYVPHTEFGEQGEYLTDRFGKEAAGIIAKVKDRPFFLNLCFHSPHTPIEGKAELVKQFQAKVRPGMKHQNAEYAAMVASLDENVGRVLAALEANGVADRTVVVFLSDNGGFIGKYGGKTVTNNAPLRSGKGSLYEGGIRVPLLVRWPGVTAAGRVCEEPVISTDLFPTLAALGRNAPASPDGMSLAPVLRDPGKKLERDAWSFHYPHYYETTTPVSAMRTREWKLLHYYEDERDELYHLREDPAETRDRAGERPEVREELRKRLFGWLGETGAQLPRRK